MAKSSKRKENQELQARIQKALKVALKFGGFEEAHHKAWVIDQMVRKLTGCQFGEYREFVRKAREGKDGPDTYNWDIGIAP